jgi:hypothetical protein
MLGYLRSDEDNQAESAIKVIDAMLETGQLDEARVLAGKILGYRQVVQLYRVAEHYVKAGDAEAGAACRAQAEAAPPGERDFAREAIMVARIQALAAAGQLKQARDELGNLVSEPARQVCEAGLFEYDRDEDVAARVAAYAEKEPIAPSLRGRALLLVAESHFAAGKNEAATDYAERAILMLCKLADPRTIPLLHRAVNLLAKLGEKKKASRWAEVCLGFAERTDAKAFWKARDLRLAAEALLAAGQKEKAEAVFKAIPNYPAKLDPFTYSRGAMEAAQAYLSSGKEELFAQVASHVLRMSRTHPHFRARAMAAMDVLAGYARNDRKLTPEIERELEATAQAIETDPNYLKPA